MVNQVSLIKIALNRHLWEQVSVQYVKGHDEENILHSTRFPLAGCHFKQGAKRGNVGVCINHCDRT